VDDESGEFIERAEVMGAFCYFYRAMHYSAKRGLAIACRLFVRLSVTLVVTGS